MMISSYFRDQEEEEEENGNYSDDDNELEKKNRKRNGYCHYNRSCDHSFEINIFDQKLHLLQKPAAIDLGIGAVVWDSSVIFSKYVELHRNDKFSITNMLGKHVLELGSGCGLAGLTLLLRGCDVTFTDLPEVVKQLTSVNVMSSYKRLITSGSIHPIKYIEPTVINLDWTTFVIDSLSYLTESKSNPSSISHSTVSTMTYDIIVCTDCVFSMKISEDLIRTIDLCSGPKTVVYCCYEIRDEATNNHFLDEFGKLFHYKTISSKQYHPEYQSDLVATISGTKKRVSKSKIQK